MDSGAKYEHELDVLINATGTSCWRRPGVMGKRVCGTGMRPDGAGYLPALNLEHLDLVDDHYPRVAGHGKYNFLLSYKGQRTPGSVKQKIHKEICDLGHWSDIDRIVAALVLDMSVGLITDQELNDWRRLGRRHAVVVLTRDEVAAGRLPAALVAVAKVRSRLYKRLGPRGGYYPVQKNDEAQQGYIERSAARRVLSAGAR